MYQDDKRIVITLDAGGTNFVFGAMRGNRFIGETITYPSNSDDLDKCLQTMIGGFREVIASLPQPLWQSVSLSPARRIMHVA